MINQQLLDFIKQQLLKGVDKETITKELLGSGWTQIDIQEGFNTINTPVVSNMNNPILTQTPNHSGKKVVFIIVALFVIAGGASGYFFRNDIPVIKDLIKSKDLAPVNEIRQEENTQTKIQQEESAIPQQEQNQDNDTNKESQPVVKTEDKKVTTAITTKTSIIDCGSDLSCFIRLANECQKSKVTITQIDKIERQMEGAISDGTYFYEIIGKENNNCISKIKILSYKLNPTVELPKETLEIMTDYSNFIKDSETSCLLSLEKKMGDILNKEIINPTEYLIENIKSSMSTDSGSVSIITYNSGMVCNQKFPLVVSSN
ncbi:TPA: hypothetical protein DIC38_01950 [Candidatus Nomurabacteria bacterium]|nr:MAG: hypothetical protein O210_OD1C00001G0341 [Parcubacteria bacterium RAAC4_OD1_1]HCY26420.1 hypothetical protein [Candidatus Nomurabacteria bacterium]